MTDVVYFVASGGFVLEVGFDGFRPVLRLEIDPRTGTGNFTSAKMDVRGCDYNVPRARTHAVRLLQPVPVGRMTRYTASYSQAEGLVLSAAGSPTPYIIADTCVPNGPTPRLTVTGKNVRGITRVPHGASSAACGWKLKKPWE